MKGLPSLKTIKSRESDKRREAKEREEIKPTQMKIDEDSVITPKLRETDNYREPS